MKLKEVYEKIKAGDSIPKKYDMNYLLDYLEEHNIVGKTLCEQINFTPLDYISLCLQCDIDEDKLNRLTNALGIKLSEFITK